MKLIATALLTLALVATGSTPAGAVAPQVPQGVVAVTAVLPLVRKVMLKDGTAPRKLVRTTAVTVADLLAEKGLALGEFDRVKPGLSTRLKKYMKVKIYRVSVTSITVLAEAVAFEVIKQKDPALRRGKRVILVAGQPGSADRTYRVTTVNGKTAKKELLSEVVLRAPVAQVLSVGTKGPRLNLARLKMWNRIARCESGGRWHINTHNGYYGGLQFSLGTWRSVGGRDFASYPHKASKAEQITVANRLYAKRGTRPWGCA
ncbi:MAG: transglycosylase family protein [Propionicimonas sp.]